MKYNLQNNLSLFSDGNSTYISSDSDQINKNILNSDLGIMKTWADQWFIKFSVGKKWNECWYQGSTDDNLFFNNHEWDNVSEYKHLEFIIQRKE